MNILRPLLAASLVLGLAACKTTEDPAKGGFFSGVANMVDGTYEDRIKERQTNLENEQDRQLQQSRQLSQVSAQSEEIALERKAAEKRYSALQTELKSLRNKLAKAETNSKQKKAEVADLTKQVEALEAKANMLQKDTFTPDAEKQKRLEALRKEREALEREVDLLIRR